MTRRAYRPRTLKIGEVTYHLEYLGRRGLKVYRRTDRGIRKGTVQDVALVEAALRRESRERAERARAVEAVAGREPPPIVPPPHTPGWPQSKPSEVADG